MDAIVRRMMQVPGRRLQDRHHRAQALGHMPVCWRWRKRIREAPMIVLAMGEMGFPTRVLSPGFGGSTPTPRPIAAQGTAAGQVSARQSAPSVPRRKISKTAKIYGVIADPVRHSISPAVHNRAFQSRRIDAVYLPFLVHPPQLRDFFALAEKLPHLRLQRDHSAQAEDHSLSRRRGSAGAPHRRRKYRLAQGRQMARHQYRCGAASPFRLRKQMRLAQVVGADGGQRRRGAGRGLRAAATPAPRSRIVGRNPDRVRALAKVCGAEPLLREQLDTRHFDALVHATPLGMFPHVNECFFNGQHSGGRGFRHGLQPAGNAC